jgi:hypothetical protein
MASIQNCVYQSVTLQPGEPFNLPSGAEIISATDINSLSSTCPLPTDLEESECYIVSFIAREVDGTRPPYQGGSASDKTFYIRGMVVNDIFYPFGGSGGIVPDASGIFPVNDIVPYISANTTLNSLLTNFGSGSHFEGGADGAVSTLCFKTIPSVAQGMYFILNTFIIGAGTPEPVTTLRVYPETRSSFGPTAGTCNCG